jgi:hypothetical protein
MKGHGEKLTRKQEQAIAALLLEPTLATAAMRCGVSEITVWRWLKRPEFQAAYREARRAAVNQAVAHLQQVCGEAVETLRAVMRDGEKPSSARVAAARSVLDLALKAIELDDLDVRLTALEQRLAPERISPNGRH